MKWATETRPEYVLMVVCKYSETVVVQPAALKHQVKMLLQLA